MKPEQQLEKDLARLGREMAPGKGFVDRIMQQIDQQSKPRGTILRRRWWIPLTSAIAAAVLIAAGLRTFLHRAIPPETVEPTQFVRSSSQWQTVSETPVTLKGDVPGRLISRQLFERVQWTDPQQHATFERLVPREKVTLITLENY